MTGITYMLKTMLASSRQQTLTIGNVDQARRVASAFTNELRNSAYGANGAYPINQASDTQIIFFSTAIKNDGTVSKVRYYTSSNTLYKGVTQPSGSPLGYGGTETITTLLSNLSLGANPLFYYYDGNYNGNTSALTQQVNINQVKFAKINLIVLRQDVTGSNATTTITAGASIRNLKTNLGN